MNPQDKTEPQVFLNGQFVPRSKASFDVEDRGALFADGIYEVIRYYWGKPLAMDFHMARLRRSLDAVQIPMSPDAARLPEITAELLARNSLREAKAYWQITRGAAPREHVFPKAIEPTILAMISPMEPLDVSKPVRAVNAITLPDERWSNCWIKSLMLLPNVIAKNAAAQAGAYEAILHRGGVVTEGTSTAFFIVRDGAIWTHPADRWILGSVTRLIVLDLAARNGLKVIERTFTVDEMFAADEAYLCGTTMNVVAVTHIDGLPIGNGSPGPVAQRLQELILQHITAACGGGRA